MATQSLLLERFMRPSSLFLTAHERQLYRIALAGEICKLHRKYDSVSRIEKLLPAMNWGILIFKPPRASTALRQTLEQGLSMHLARHNLICLGLYEVAALTRTHIHHMYPGDSMVVYWSDLERCLLGLPATYHLIASPQATTNVGPLLESIKGWYKPDPARRRFSNGIGLRRLFRELVVVSEGKFPEMPDGSPKYEDSGIHAPCSTTSRFVQLLGFMSCDSGGADWARGLLPWLTPRRGLS